jgi:hypothetical protein
VHDQAHIILVQRIHRKPLLLAQNFVLKLSYSSEQDSESRWKLYDEISEKMVNPIGSEPARVGTSGF